jgi:hypothetical protein
VKDPIVSCGGISIDSVVAVRGKDGGLERGRVGRSGRIVTRGSLPFWVHVD